MAPGGCPGHLIAANSLLKIWANWPILTAEGAAPGASRSVGPGESGERAMLGIIRRRPDHQGAFDARPTGGDLHFARDLGTARELTTVPTAGSLLEAESATGLNR